MLSVHQKKMNGGNLAVTATFGQLVNWVEEEDKLSVNSTEEVGPPVDPSVTAPVIYGSQSTTYGSRTVILVSTAAPGSYILPANIGYRIVFAANVIGYHLVPAAGETVDLGELRNRTSGTQSIRIYGSLAPYKMQYYRFSVRTSPSVNEAVSENLIVVPTINLVPFDASTVTNFVTFTDNWGGSGILFTGRSGNLTFRVKRPNNSFPNCARYTWGQVNGGVTVLTTETLILYLNDLVGSNVNNSIAISTGEFKPSGLAASSNLIEESAAVARYNQQFGTNLPSFAGTPPSVCTFHFFGGLVTSCVVTMP